MASCATTLKRASAPGRGRCPPARRRLTISRLPDGVKATPNGAGPTSARVGTLAACRSTIARPGLSQNAGGDRGDAPVGRNGDLDRLPADVDDLGRPRPGVTIAIVRRRSCATTSRPPRGADRDRAAAQHDLLLGRELRRPAPRRRARASGGQPRGAAPRRRGSRGGWHGHRSSRTGAGLSSQSIAARSRARASAIARDSSAVCGSRSLPPVS